MSKSLNFNTIKKNIFTVTLADKDKTTLLITTPTKAIFENLLEMQDVNENSNVDAETLNDLYETCAMIMSRNKAKIEVTREELENLFDFEDIMIFIKSYTQFVNDVASQKN